MISPQRPLRKVMPEQVRWDKVRSIGIQKVIPRRHGPQIDCRQVESYIEQPLNSEMAIERTCASIPSTAQ
jgi:hypothetical protein